MLENNKVNNNTNIDSSFGQQLTFKCQHCEYENIKLLFRSTATASMPQYTREVKSMVMNVHCVVINSPLQKRSMNIKQIT